MKRRHRNSEHNTALASRILQRQLHQQPNESQDQPQQVIIQVSQQQTLNLPPPNHVPPQMHQPPPPVSQIQHPSPSYQDNSSDGSYKLPDDSNNDVYRVPSYVPVNALPMATMGYYIPPIHPQMLQTRNQ